LIVKNKNILLVEGRDDEHTIYAIRDIYEIPETSFAVGKEQGITNVLEKTEAELRVNNRDQIERLGIVIDADENLNNRWQSVTNILQKAGYANIPDLPDSTGTIIEQDGKIKFGVWIMPDNQINQGYLETFLRFFIPDDDEAWEKARECVANLNDKPFIRANVDHTQKAEIHTYLAWQEEPGKPFGTSITAKYLQADNPQCRLFVDWLIRLFVN